MKVLELHEEVKKFVEERLHKYPTKRSLLVPTLLTAQEHHGGYITPDLICAVADYLDVPEQEVYSTASFYSLLNKHPVGRHVIMACHNVSCYLRGADSIVKALEERLKVKVGETTADGRFTLFTVECLAACGGAPALIVDRAFFENVSVENLDEILANFE